MAIIIFSIFLINPSPICVLDEVDAALDEVNVEKFCKIMKIIESETNTKFLHHGHDMVDLKGLSREAVNSDYAILKVDHTG